MNRKSKLIIDGVLWFFALCVLVILITSCNPYVTQPTVTAEPTTTILSINPSVTPSATPEICTVATGYNQGALNLRRGAGTQYAVIRTLAEGETLIVIKRAAWLEVIDNQGTRGFINSKYCKE